MQISKFEIAKFLDNKSYIDNLDIFTTISSTNDYLLELTDKVDDIRICIAEQQTKGRGRNNKTWVSPKGNLYFSILWTPLKRLEGLSIEIGTALVGALKEFGIEHGLNIKLPNDVFWQKRKLAGILIEIKHNKPVIGIGINIEMPKTDGKKVDQPWVDLQEIINNAIDVNKLIGLLINHIVKILLEY